MHNANKQTNKQTNKQKAHSGEIKEFIDPVTHRWIEYD